MIDYASLCFLSYKRPQFIFESIRSAVENADFPCEVIVHDDGSDDNTVQQLVNLQRQGQISKLVLSPFGHNEGVGTAINRSFAMATGDPICKLDQDLLFKPGWLRKTYKWLAEDPDIGMFGLFRYHADPVDWRKMNHRAPPGELGTEYEYVDDFVGSAMVVPREVLDRYGDFEEHSAAFAEDVMYKKMLQRDGEFELALPREDLAVNRGFGIGPSTVVVAPGKVQEIKTRPLLFNAHD